MLKDGIPVWYFAAIFMSVDWFEFTKLPNSNWTMPIWAQTSRFGQLETFHTWDC